MGRFLSEKHNLNAVGYCNGNNGAKKDPIKCDGVFFETKINIIE
jgi:hypothetical protein